MQPGRLQKFSLALLLATLLLVACGMFLVQVENEQPAWRFSVKLSRMRGKAKQTRIPQQLVLTSKDSQEHIFYILLRVKFAQIMK